MATSSAILVAMAQLVDEQCFGAQMHVSILPWIEIIPDEAQDRP